MALFYADGTTHQGLAYLDDLESDGMVAADMQLFVTGNANSSSAWGSRKIGWNAIVGMELSTSSSRKGSWTG